MKTTCLFKFGTSITSLNRLGHNNTEKGFVMQKKHLVGQLRTSQVNLQQVLAHKTGITEYTEVEYLWEEFHHFVRDFFKK